MIGVLPGEVTQAVMVPTTLVSSWVRDVGKEMPRAEPVVCMLVWASKPKTRLETFPICICSGDTIGTIIVVPTTCSPHNGKFLSYIAAASCDLLNYGTMVGRSDYYYELLLYHLVTVRTCTL